MFIGKHRLQSTQSVGKPLLAQNSIVQVPALNVANSARKSQSERA
jgi:hypothetical protein